MSSAPTSVATRAAAVAPSELFAASRSPSAAASPTGCPAGSERSAGSGGSGGSGATRRRIVRAALGRGTLEAFGALEALEAFGALGQSARVAVRHRC